MEEYGREATTAAKERRPAEPDEESRDGREQLAGEHAADEGEDDEEQPPERTRVEDAAEDDEMIGGGSLGRRKAQ